MDPITAGAAISSAASLVGGFMGNDSAKKEASKNRRFQMQMAQQAHQIEVKDLKRAGLNPRLSGLGGNGAPVPSGATAQQRDPLSGAANTALAAIRLKEEVKNIRETNNLLQTQQSLNMAQANSANSLSNKTNVDAAVKSRLLPAADAINTVASKALNSARGLAAENRDKGFGGMMMTTPANKGGALRAIGAWGANKLGF